MTTTTHTPTAKPAYTRPSLLRHRSGLMNKMGTQPSLTPTEAIDGVPVETLVEAYGSPLFVYSQRTIEHRYRALRDELARRYPKVQPAWSYKTCYLDAVCRVYHKEGAWAETVSGMEVNKALRNGVPMHKVVFNGPHKEDAALLAALKGGALVNIDHFDELARIEQLSKIHGLFPQVGIRLNMATGTTPRWDRFGFNLDNGQAWDAVRRLTAGGRMSLRGLHAHFGTFVLDADNYRIGASKVAAFANRLRTELGITLEYLDLGGGFASKNRLKSQYLPGEQVTPSLAQYAEALTKGLADLDYPAHELPTLITETGRGLIDEAGTLITTVIANKRLADGRRAVVVDAGVNLLYTAFWYNFEVETTAPVHGVPEPTVIFGPLCMNIDVVREHIMLPALPVGTRLLIRPVGAYAVTQSMQFIHLRPAVTMIGLDGQHGVIKSAETLDDLVRGEVVPDWVEGAASVPGVEPTAPTPRAQTVALPRLTGALPSLTGATPAVGPDGRLH